VGHILLIAEKPDAMRRIAAALAENNSLRKKVSKQKVEYYEFERHGKKHIIVAAVGHLFTLDAKEKDGWKYPVFECVWVPAFQNGKKRIFSKKYFETIREVKDEASEYIVCCDYDVEGSTIAANILKYICGVNDAKRMKFSTLVKEEIVEAYENASPHLDFNQIEVGLTRHELDALWGFNLTRALTSALKNQANKGFAILSAGRVQSPMLNLLLQRELEIRNFVPKPYWQLELHAEINGVPVSALHEAGKFWKREEVEQVLNECRGKEALVKAVERRKYKQNPPVPFNTTDLQTEAYNQFGFSPAQTMNIAESLYQIAAISYPRTNSQKLPSLVDYERILRALATLPQYRPLCESLLAMGKLIPQEGKKSDEAHPAIYCTHEVPDLQRLTPQQRKLYDLIVRRTLAVFAQAAIKESMKIIISIGKNDFLAVGRRILREGWISYYKPYVKFEEQMLPEVIEGDRVKVLGLNVIKKQTQPPARYTQGSIIKEMERRKLGTSSTRSEILQTLYDRKYIVGKSIRVTKLGEIITAVLRENVPSIVSEELTRHFEQEMELVFHGKKSRSEVVEDAKRVLLKILEQFREKEVEIGKKLLQGLIDLKREARTVGTCPSCGGELMIIKSSKSGKRFIGCSNYPKCRLSFPIPLNGEITPLREKCGICGMPLVEVRRKGKRPFRMCINHKCKSKEGWKRSS